jgi:uncharacterized protein DUF3592
VLSGNAILRGEDRLTTTLFDARSMQVKPRVAIWCIVAAFGTAPRVPALWTYGKLLRQGIPVDGVITSFEPQQHNCAHYVYSVGSRRFEGAADRQHTQVGTKVTVYYLPADPEVTCLGSPVKRFLGELIFTLISLAVMPALGVFIVTRSRRWRELTQRAPTKTVTSAGQT